MTKIGKPQGTLELFSLPKINDLFSQFTIRLQKSLLVDFNTFWHQIT
jgi:hypothetical protein